MNTDKNTIEEVFIEVGEGHELYVQSWGAASSSRKFIFLHGGPGSGCSDGHKLLFDADRDHVIFFDQRGSGRSKPYGSLNANTTQHLIKDMTTILDRYAIEKVVIVGGSWGSTLGLAYALEFPDRVGGLVLRGIFTGSQSEVDYLEHGGIEPFYPDVWAQFRDSVPKPNRTDPASYWKDRLFADNETEMRSAAYAFAQLEGSVVKLDDRTVPVSLSDFDPYPIRTEIHYTASLCFMPADYILQHAHRLKMPMWIIQGRYDSVCPPITAHRLHESVSQSQLIWTLAGHSGSDRANFDATRMAITSLNSSES